MSKAVSRALRHEPWLFELELDEHGWTSADNLLEALRKEVPEWSDLTLTDLQMMIDSAAKPRHEIQGDRIRAFYGHSTQGAITLAAATPPAELFHGTSPESIGSIFSGGLQPMSRQYVHMSADAETAVRVGNRKSKHPVILTIDTVAALASDIAFYRGSGSVWLAKDVPAEFIRIDRAG
ncbi:RNA 2'-phosphotransferase [Paenarthrobacter sp. AMU7]|uniref:Probable RNA 2'-phosphotransferase n=1 Tax=Paenarthrobacter sp. AMU7 TaxID=3162492 RepID=A0AB39YLQ0_9MICC